MLQLLGIMNLLFKSDLRYYLKETNNDITAGKI